MLNSNDVNFNGLDKRVDARIINLYQSNVNGHRLFANAYQYNVFAHYEKIDVRDANAPATDRIDDSPLLRAYCARLSEDHYEPQQTLLAFTDIVNSDYDNNAGYTQKQIEDFWNCDSEPLLFLSMVSLDVNQDYTSVFKKINDIYTDDLHLVYITFDFCHLLIFSKGRSFQKCAERILTLDYASDIKIVDSITLYSFAYNFADCLALDEKETFGAYLRFGVADIDVMTKFENALKAISKEKKIEKNWIIGRHDVGILCQNANLNWLAAAWGVANTFSDEWYTSFTLSIMISPSSHAISGSLPSKTEHSGLLSIMDKSFEKFSEVYTSRLEESGVPVDKVWLRWLQETSQQAVALIENKMTRELGVSLVPQFLDFFQYAYTLWSNDDLRQGSKWDEAENCFAVLLSNISILVDSMNHHSRQFISSPPFRTVAFDMPPKLMAYYTMILHQLIFVLQDEVPNRKYGFTITPQFTHTFSVRTLTHKSRDLLANSQFITIGISEEAVYQVQRTTAALTHEISHFVGWVGRSREVRKKNVVYAEIYNTVLSVVYKFYSDLLTYYRISTELSDFCEIDIPNMVDQLYGLLVDYYPEYNESDSSFLEDLRVLLQFLPYRIHNNTALCKLLFECCWKLILQRDGHLSELGNAIQQIECQRTGMPLEAPFEALKLSEQNIYRLFRKSLHAYSIENYTPSDEFEPRWIRICELFSEAYADLQAILLLELDFSSYINLFIVKASDEIPIIELSRILSLALTLEGRVGWKASDFAQNQTINDLIQKYKAFDRISLIDVCVDPIAVQKLQEYLNHCSNIIMDKFMNHKAKEAQTLRTLYNALSNENTALGIVERLSKEIQTYRESLLFLPNK